MVKSDAKTLPRKMHAPHRPAISNARENDSYHIFHTGHTDILGCIVLCVTWGRCKIANPPVWRRDQPVSPDGILCSPVQIPSYISVKEGFVFSEATLWF